jgi:ribosomal protein S18 acetylase RimI-like enzyme
MPKKGTDEVRSRRSDRVRAARPSDIDAMVELLGCLFAQEADFTPDPDKQRRALALILANPAVGRLFVVAQGRKVVGMVGLHFTVSTAEGGRVAWLEDLVVHPSCRGRGLGTILLREALAWARSRGLARITLLTDGDNARARRLYRRHGFRASAMHPLRLPLARPSRRHAVGIP